PATDDQIRQRDVLVEAQVPHDRGVGRAEGQQGGDEGCQGGEPRDGKPGVFHGLLLSVISLLLLLYLGPRGRATSGWGSYLGPLVRSHGHPGRLLSSLIRTAAAGEGARRGGRARQKKRLPGPG